MAPRVSDAPARLSLASLLSFLLFPHVKLLLGVRVLRLVLASLLFFAFLFLFRFECQLPVKG